MLMAKPWIFRDRSVSDWTYVFSEKGFDTEEEARKYFRESRARAEKNGGAGSLHNDGEVKDQFSIWSPND